jgi:hypothetical protein
MKQARSFSCLFHNGLLCRLHETAICPAVSWCGDWQITPAIDHTRGSYETAICSAGSWRRRLANYICHRSDKRLLGNNQSFPAVSWMWRLANYNTQGAVSKYGLAVAYGVDAPMEGAWHTDGND